MPQLITDLSAARTPEIVDVRIATNPANLSVAGGDDLTIPLSPLVQEGDLMVAFVSWDSPNTSRTPPAGWKTEAEITASAQPTGAIYSKPVVAGEPASYSWNVTTAVSTAGRGGAIITLRNASFDSGGVSLIRGGSDPGIVPTVTNQVQGARLLAFIGRVTDAPPTTADYYVGNPPLEHIFNHVNQSNFAYSFVDWVQSGATEANLNVGTISGRTFAPLTSTIRGAILINPL